MLTVLARQQNTELPNIPSALLRTSVRDVRACLTDPRYEVRMDYWYDPGEQCRVCMAGAVLAQSCGFGPTYFKGFTLPEPGYILPRPLQQQLKCVNHMRVGDFAMAIIVLWENDPTGLMARLGASNYNDLIGSGADLECTMAYCKSNFIDALRVASNMVQIALPGEPDDDVSVKYYAPLEVYDSVANYLEEIGL